MQIRRVAGAAIAVVGLCATAACAGSPSAPPALALDRSDVAFDQVGIDTTRSDVTALVAAASRIGSRLAAPNDRTSATAVSPWSVLSLLGMLRAGAEGEAAAQLDAVGLGGARDLPKAMAALTGQLAQWAGDPGTIRSGAPPAAPLFQSQVGLLTAKEPAVSSDYLAALAKSYGTGVYPVDFGSGIDEPLGEWAAVNTGSTLTSAPVRVDAATRLAAATTAYLAVAWRFPFDPARTRALPFTDADGSVTDVPTLRGTMPARVAAGDGFTALQLDYGTSTLALQVVLPNPGLPLADAASDGRFTAARLALAGAPTAVHEVNLPKWRTAAWTALVDPLRELGLTSVFPNGSGLSGIAPQSPVLADARSAAVLTVGEKGTASDSVPASAPPTADPPPGSAPFLVNRAFAYSVVDTATGLPLLLGTVSSPSS